MREKLFDPIVFGKPNTVAPVSCQRYKSYIKALDFITIGVDQCLSDWDHKHGRECTNSTKWKMLQSELAKHGTVCLVISHR